MLRFELADETRVLGGELEGELRRAAAAALDAFDGHVRVEVAGSSRAQHRHHRAQVEPGAAGERQRFERRHAGRERDHAVHQLGDTAGAARSEVEGGAADLLEQRRHARNRCVVAADHEHQHARLRARRAAGQRRVDEMSPGGGDSFAQLAHALRRVGRQIDEHRIGPCSLQPLRRHRVDHIGRRQRQERHLRIGRNSGNAVANPRTCIAEPPGARRVRVEDRNLVSVSDEIARNRTTDVPQSNKSDPHANVLSERL